MLKKVKTLAFLFFMVVLAYFFAPYPVLASEPVFHHPLGMEFVLIPAGTFTMGSPPDEPHRSKTEAQHPVTISKPFYMQDTEVTLKQWRAIMGKRFFGRRKGTGDMPVARVSWYDCMKFIKKLNAREKGVYRLPTEAEWEYACRAGTTTAYSWGSRIDCSRAMYSNNRIKSGECLNYVKSRGMAFDGAVPVKSYPPNAYRLYDMHGNVWEWCIYRHEDYRTLAVADPLGTDLGTRKIRRGGSWFGPGYLCRSANRNVGHPASRYRTTGFRLVWTESGDLIGKAKERERKPMEEEDQDGP